MIRLDRPPAVPKRLSTKGQSRTDQHRAEYKANSAKFISGEWTFQFDRSVYAAKPVRKSLANMHNCKCCYCERKLPLNHLAVDHFRPKGGVKQSVNHKMKKPGYFWLAYCWDNLFLVCHRCNSSNKQNLFPLQNPTKRARPPSCKIDDEKPLLINPASQDPRRHIRFVDDTPVDRTKKGRETIKGIGLDLADLRGWRGELLLEIDAKVVALKEALDKPGDEELQKKASVAREFLDQAVKPQSKFSSMAMDYIAGFEI